MLPDTVAGSRQANRVVAASISALGLFGHALPGVAWKLCRPPSAPARDNIGLRSADTDHSGRLGKERRCGAIRRAARERRRRRRGLGAQEPRQFLTPLGLRACASIAVWSSASPSAAVSPRLKAIDVAPAL